MIQRQELTAVGKFQKTHALKGELNAVLEIDPAFLEEGNAIVVDVDGIFVPFFASSVRPKGATSFLIKLDGIDSGDEADPFVNKTIYALTRELAPFMDVDEDEITDDDGLVGYKVVDKSSGSEIGEILAVDSSTENLLFVVETSDGEEVFIPAVEEFVDSVDDDSHSIFVSLPDGLLDLNKKKINNE